MKRVTVYQTIDGVNHPDFDTAERHARRRYSNAIAHHAHELAVMNFTQAAEYINNNLDAFAHMVQMRADQLIAENNEDDT